MMLNLSWSSVFWTVRDCNRCIRDVSLLLLLRCASQVNNLIFFPKGSLLDSKIDQGKGILVMSGNGNSGSGNSGGGNIGGGMNAQWDALSKWADANAALNEV